MICGSCGAENKPGRKFCGECAAPLGAACPSCGSANDPGVKFCGECGSALVPGRPPATAIQAATGDADPGRAAEAERRVVSVLFADLVGFTALAEGRDAEEARELLSSYFELARTTIERHGGTVEKFIGDAVMAVWGAPVAHEDDAERAVRAALELVATVGSIGAGVAARAGVLTGEAAVTLGATNQGMVAGDLVNTASRLQSVAPGTVLVDEATHRAASAAVTFEAAGEQVLRGKQAPVPAWRALRVVAELGGRNRSETLEAPFVGREAEFRLLKELYHATARERRTRLVSVMGPAGIGKTRLAWEFEKYLDGLVETVLWHHGRSPAYGEGITFWALGEMVRRRAELLETDDEETTRAKVAAVVTAYVARADDRAWVERSLLALLGVQAGDARPEELFGAWRTFIEGLAAEGAVVLVFEDLHWADAGLLDFLDHLLEWSRHLPILILTLARPELLERRPDWGAGKRDFTSLGLDPLSPVAMRELLTGLVRGLPEPAVRSIVARADGVPLYAMETVRMLIAEGRLELVNGTCVPKGDLSSLAVPETLSALIGSRLDALDPTDRALLQDAAVLGQSFTVQALAGVAGVEPGLLEPRLRGLVRRELLTLEADPRSPERGQYGFVQSLVREVAYNTLARNDRKVRHLAAARFFESLETEELAAALAGHCLAAYRNAQDPAEAEALRAQARISLRAAAERAAALGSHEQAVNLLGEALTVATTPAEEADLMGRAGESATAAGFFQRGEQLMREALARRDVLGDRPAIARAVEALGRALLNAGTTDQAITFLEARLPQLADLGDEPAVIALEGQLARAYMFHAESRRAIEVADRVLERAEALELVDVVANTLITRGSALGALGRTYEGMGALEAGSRLAEANGLNLARLRGLGNRAALLVDTDPQAALETARATMALERRLGWRSSQPYGVAAVAARSTGDWDWMISCLADALAETADRALRLDLLLFLGTYLCYRGEPVDDLLTEMESLLVHEVERTRRINPDWIRAERSWAEGGLDEARAGMHRLAALVPEAGSYLWVQAARAALWARDGSGAALESAPLEASPLKGPVYHAHRLALRAGVWALEGRIAEALAAYRAVLATWRDLRLPFEEALVGLDMVELLGPAEPDARLAGESARRSLTDLRAKPFLERLERALGPAEGGDGHAAPAPVMAPSAHQSVAEV
ncbi:MAG: AAA family ATPase [Candidatus Limnocylindrales bacterium]